MSETDTNATPNAPDPERDAIIADEEKLLRRANEAVANIKVRYTVSYDAELLALRDEIAEARAEDIPPLMQQMERLQGIAARRNEVTNVQIDPGSPYFGHMRLVENGRGRDVLIGNATLVDVEVGVRIVDWRDAPVSKLYYRYAEGDDYEEEINGRTVEGTMSVRRAVVVTDASLRRVITPGGTFIRRGDPAYWQRIDSHTTKLKGGAGVAERPPALDEYTVRRGQLGVRVAGREERHLPDIPALIDKRQFELISKPTSGLVVIQGGAGSGKTTIGLHRIAYLAFQEPKRFSADKLLVVVFNQALASYIGRVLPSLGVQGVTAVTYRDWAAQQRRRHLQRLPNSYTEDTPSVVSRLKKHPVLLRLIDERVAAESASIDAAVTRAIQETTQGPRALSVWNSTSKWPIAQRVATAGLWSRGEREINNDKGNALARDTRMALDSALDRVRRRAQDVVWDWAEMLTNYRGLRAAFDKHFPDDFSDDELASAVRYCSERIGRISDIPDRAHHESENDTDDESGKVKPLRSRKDRDDAMEMLDAESFGSESKSTSREREREDEDEGIYRAMDGRDERTVDDDLSLDPEDDALLLRLYQRKRGPLRRDRKSTLLYEHIFVDEAQDLSPIELSVLLDTATPARCVTLAGDTAQRLLMDNGFKSWGEVLADLGLQTIAVEPLRVGYRSTAEVLDFARHVLGPLAEGEPPVATRSGAPVEMHRYGDTGAAMAFLGASLRSLMIEEPRANVCVIAKDPERAELYYRGLLNAEVPRLTHVANQDFTFKNGVEVTDVRQVKGLEWDYVILVDVTESMYPQSDENRHLLHIASTRAAHQLWVVCSQRPSSLLPESMQD
ncbi:MAG: ATP-binding domain-containing protein [Deltaproteobacteria bacterium]|nr:ATP-binding domain-containing protein [Deltaproteobacteria bacterium]